MTTYHLRGARVIDPANERDETRDLWLVDGKIAHAAPAHPAAPADNTTEA